MTVAVGVVGTGYLGRLHARVLTEIPEAEVGGCVEINDSVAGELGESLKLKRFESVAALASDVQCAVVATPTITHFEIDSELLDAGCDVMVEKAFTQDVEQASTLIDLAN